MHLANASCAHEYVQAYATDKQPVEEAALRRVTGVLDAFPSGQGEAAATASAAEGATRFIGAALKWCRGCAR